MKTNITLAFKGRYIEHPYWPEMYQKIEIEKKSGVNRARTDANRRKALEAYLIEIGMTLPQYEVLCKTAEEPFHKDPQGRIIIPSDKVIAALVNGNDVAPRKSKIENLRIAVRSTDFVTNKTAPDGVWQRFAVVTTGGGMKASNQRGMRSNPYIENFTATGTIEVEESMVDPQALMNLLVFSGRVTGIGASRKMGYGRFEIQK